MFTDKEITAYRNIKAPADLRQKITKSQKRPNKILYLTGTIAACFILIVSGFVMNNQSNIVINGQKLTDSIVFYDTSSVAGRAVSSSISIPIELKVSHNTKVTVSHGFISVDGSTHSNEITLSSSKMIWWEINPYEADGIFEMRISDKKGIEKIALKYENSKITVTKENEKWKRLSHFQ